MVGQFALIFANLAGPIWHRSHPGFQLALCGAVLITVAVVCGVFGAAALGRNLTPLPLPSSRARLVRNGIYGLMRHPLYTAVMAGAFGWGLLWGSWPALVAAGLLSPLLDAKARMEERWLRQRFTEYETYARRVRRFLPGIY